jgi:hypothetical protein
LEANCWYLDDGVVAGREADVLPSLWKMGLVEDVLELGQV